MANVSVQLVVSDTATRKSQHCLCEKTQSYFIMQELTETAITFLNCFSTGGLRQKQLDGKLSLTPLATYLQLLFGCTVSPESNTRAL